MNDSQIEARIRTSGSRPGSEKTFMWKFVATFSFCVLVGALGSSQAQEMDVTLKPVKRSPASVDPARPFNQKSYPDSKSLKNDPGRKYKNLRISPRRQPQILDIDISIKTDGE